MRDARKPASWPVAGSLACTLATAGCQLFVDLDGLEDRHCAPDEKACGGGCVSEGRSATGCNDPGCAPVRAAARERDLRPEQPLLLHRRQLRRRLGRLRRIDRDTAAKPTWPTTPGNCGDCGHRLPGPAERQPPAARTGECVIGKLQPGLGRLRPRPRLNGCEAGQIWTDLECASLRASPAPRPPRARQLRDRGVCASEPRRRGQRPCLRISR